MDYLCHHWRSRQFTCACGAVLRWPKKTNELECECGRIHTRGKDGPRRVNQKKRRCEGVALLRAMGG